MTRPWTLLWVAADASATNAGFRIRTQPLITALRERGVAVQVITYAELYAQILQLVDAVDAVVMSKPNDSTSHLCLRAFQARGVPVAMDVFDNYLSWSPAVAQRELHWQLLRLLADASLVITSTHYLKRVVATVRQGPLLRVSDPLPTLPAGGPETRLAAAKWPLDGGCLELTWFGMGNNGFYSVGLQDLDDWHATLIALREARAGNGGIRVTICTNRVAALDTSLARLRRDGISARFVEWTEDACSHLVAASHVVLLPTNLSGFSLSKTHNRCSDALARRCLVLASPQGPYRDLAGAVAVSVQGLLALLDRVQREPAQIDVFVRAALQRLAPDCDTARHAERLHDALLAAARALKNRPATASPVLVVAQARLETVKLSRRLGYLTAGLTDGLIKANLDLSLQAHGNGPVLASFQLSAKAWEALRTIWASDPEVDVAASTSTTECRRGSWRFRIDHASLRGELLAQPDAALEAAVRQVALLSPPPPHQVARWYGPMVSLLTRSLVALGLPHQAFATEDAGGWTAFAETAAPDLGRLAEQLRDLWRQHAGRELGWGSPVAEVPA